MRKKVFALLVATIMVATLIMPAFAANMPFADVPKDHWAYDSVAELAAAGLVIGYPDGTFKGDRQFTRY
ncbi:MAG: S-layer homology domain-containing protein, partial [Firmicutes bacterium]|nr:S-layer homology domain-containing protein [Bacillota bacterium]